MKQMGLRGNEFELASKRTRKREFLDEMNRVVPWADLTMLIEPHYPKGKTGRPPFGIATMLRIHSMQQRWWSPKTRADAKDEAVWRRHPRPLTGGRASRSQDPLKGG